jgi:hypothetical protein
LTPILNARELDEEGRRMEHCVATYADDVLRGKTYFFRWLGDERATVQLERRERSWVVAQHLGLRNRTLSPSTVAAIHMEVAAARSEPWSPPAGTDLQTYVAGAAYYDASDVFDGLRPGQMLALRRQPDNPHDRLAIEVLTADGRKLGYVPRGVNAAPAAAMDRGEQIDAWIAAVGSGLDIDIRLAARAREAA